MKKKITSVLIILLCVLMAVPWGVFAQAVNAEKSAENTQQQATAPAPTPTTEQPAETSAEPRDESASTLADYPAGRAVLRNGEYLHSVFRQLSGDMSDELYSNSTIKAILRSNSPAPSSVSTINLSISDVSVTAWWNASSQTIYWYSEDAKPMLNADSRNMFRKLGSVKKIDVSHFDTSKVKDMRYMFWDCYSLTELDVSSIDTSNVTDMGYMFFECRSLTGLNLSSFDTSNVTNMSSMFSGCSKLTYLDVSNFDTSKVTDMNGMFSDCESLTSLDLSNFDTSKVTDMNGMFMECGSLTSLDLSNFDTSKVLDMGWMFRESGQLKTIYVSESFTTVDAEYAESIYYMFGSCYSLVGGNGTKYDSSHKDAEYARIDKPGQPGYFTYKKSSLIPKPIIPTPTPVTPTPDPEIEPFKWGVDNFSFENISENFYTILDYTIGKITGRKYKTYRTLINGKYQNALKSKLSPKEYSRILGVDVNYERPLWIDNKGEKHYESEIDKEWGGSCQGMSTLVLLGKAGMVPYSEYGGSSIHSLPMPKDNDDLCSLINYYQLTQSTDTLRQLILETYKKTDKHNIQQILVELKKNGTVLVGYNYPGEGHAVIAYGEGDGRIIDGKTYDKSIKICDPNDTTENSNNFIYYDSNTYDWIIPKKNKNIKSSAGAKISNVLSDPIMANHSGYLSLSVKTNVDTAMDNGDISTLENKTYIARLEIYQGNVSGIKKVTKDINGNYVEKADQGDGSDIVKETIYSGDQDAKGTPGYTLSDAESAYQVTQDTAGPMELVLDYENTLYHVRAEKAKSVIFDKNGFVSVDADKGNCAVEMTNNNDNPTDWFTNYAKTTDATKLSMTKTKEGYEVASDNLKDTKVMAANKEETKEENVSTQKDKMIICETKKDLDVKVDNTGDGKYETSIVDNDKPSGDQAIAYRTHVQNVGWQPYMTNGTIAGTSGFGYRLEAMNINLQNQKYTGDIEYRTHIENIGWESEWKKNDAMSGTSNRGLRLEAMQVRLTGEMAEKYDVYYRVHAQNIGWLGWAKNGEESGTAGYGYRLEAMQIMLVDKGGAAPTIAPTSATDKPFVEKFKDNVKTDSLVAYQNHVQNVGWQNYAVDGGVAGTSGLGYRLEGMKIFLNNPKYKGDIEYRTHIENIGWENEWKKNDAMSGTSGLGYRLEAMQVRLTGEMASHYDVYYRVHAQNFGWLGWAKNGEESGTEGYGYRLEAMQIVLVDKDLAALNILLANNENSPFVQK
ncbi:MAG: BspA family leucine-rich repeat surface protein [Eubacteriaceae bacterium]|nr:BspA family leucine-rich repeat surface protein [Eubacteriaceae bacterium]